MTLVQHRRDRSAIVLLTLTVAGFVLSRSAFAPIAIGVALMTIAVIKARLVVLDYFGFRGAQGPWCVILFAWIGVVAIAALSPSIYQLVR